MKIPTSFRILLAGLLVPVLFPGCETDSTGETAGGPAMATSLPISALNAMYNSREAMINLATGEAADPVQAFAVMRSSMAPLNAFGERIHALGTSFNDADYLHFWNQLASFGSLYQINTGTLSAAQLRSHEQSLWSFKNDVYALDRAYHDYLTMLRALLDALGPEASSAEVQQHVPLVNAITQKTIELDVLMKDFAEDLFTISRNLSQASMGI